MGGRQPYRQLALHEKYGTLLHGPSLTLPFSFFFFLKKILTWNDADFCLLYTVQGPLSALLLMS
jgi:hypothetical protein